jgi:hypothetical protein
MRITGLTYQDIKELDVYDLKALDYASQSFERLEEARRVTELRRAMHGKSNDITKMVRVANSSIQIMQSHGAGHG